MKKQAYITSLSGKGAKDNKIENLTWVGPPLKRVTISFGKPELKLLYEALECQESQRFDALIEKIRRFTQIIQNKRP